MAITAGPTANTQSDQDVPDNGRHKGHGLTRQGNTAALTGRLDPAAAIRLLRSWREGGDEDLREQRETWEFLRKALDEDRPGYRKLYS